MRRLSEFLRKFYRQYGTRGYFLKCDVRKYFDNIDHKVLKQRLAAFPDERVRDLLFMIIDSHNKDTGKGLPLGNQTSQWFSLYYLDPIDRLIKEKYRIKYYTRYMDDLILIHEDKEYLKEVLTGIRAFAEKYARGEITAEEIQRSLVSYNGHLKHGHTWKLKNAVYTQFVLHRTENASVEHNVEPNCV